MKKIQTQGDKTEAQVLLGSENRSTGASGVRKPKHRRALGSTWGRFGGSERRSGGVRGGRGRPPAAEFFFSFPEV